jgi:hypothetical protein
LPSDFEFGFDTTSFFSRSDDRLKLEEKKMAFRVCGIEHRKGCLALEKRSEYIDEIREKNSASAADNGS